jgi:lipoprotein NlpD
MISPSLRNALTCTLAAAIAAGCSTQHGAPVVDRAPGARPVPDKPAIAGKPAPKPADTRPEFYIVRKGDTLYSIALDQGLDYRELAQWNGITDPGVIGIGQQLQLKPPAAAATAAALKTAPGVQGRPLGDAAVAGVQGRPLGETAVAGVNTKSEPTAVRAPYSQQTYAQMASAKPEPAAKSETQSPEGDDNVAWNWPASGKVVSTFNDSANLKGIGIAGKLGQPVLASAPGRVIFSGTGIRGFGKLIVIKHNNTFLSVYAHNHELLVKEGQSVTKGQKIAEMGSTDTDQVKLHFEIRRYGKPVDPAKLLPPA